MEGSVIGWHGPQRNRHFLFLFFSFLNGTEMMVWELVEVRTLFSCSGPQN